jgi:hypothetical protein
VAIRFEGSAATVTRLLSPRTRRLVAGAALGVATCCAALMWLGAGWMFWVGAAGLALTAMFGALAGLPDERIVFDAAARQVSVAKRYPWQGAETVQPVPFSGVYSIGVDRGGVRYGGYDYTAVLRLNGGRNVALWSIDPGRRRGRDLARFVESDPDLAGLQKLTGFHREDRLTGGWFG